MRYLSAIAISVLIVCGAPAGSSPLAEFDKALAATVDFEHGKDAAALVTAERIVIESLGDPAMRADVEQRLLRALEASRTRDAKDFLCRQLRTVGTARAVPHLEKLLTDEELSHMARYALGRIEDPAAAAALHRALNRTSGKTQVGILDTLAERRYKPAFRDVARLVQSPDARVAGAAARAMGHLGGPGAVKVLDVARVNAAGPLRHRIDLALLRCAEQFLAAGQTDEAIAVYRRFYASGETKHLQLAGLRGLVMADAERAIPLLVKAIVGDDVQLSRDAIGMVPIVPGQDATRTFATLLPSLAPQRQELLVYALGERNDSAACDAIAGATKSADERVRLAAVEALGNVGTASAVRPLAQAAAAGQATEKLVARASLARLQGSEIDAALLDSLGAGDAQVRAEIIRALAQRKVTSAFDRLLVAARDDSEVVRREAIKALGSLAGPSDVKVLVGLAVAPRVAEDRPTVEQAVGAALSRMENKDEQAAPLLEALDGAPGEARPVLLRLLGRPTTPKALRAVRAGLDSGDVQLRDAAIRTLAAWPTAAPADDLLELARESDDRTHKVIALRGYIRMAGLSDDPAGMYLRAMTLAGSADDKKLVLAGLGTADSAQALDLVEKSLGDSELKDEASLAAVQIADRLRHNDATRARASLDAVLAATANARVREQAQAVINEMEKYQGYILTWMAAGPYAEKGKESRAVFDKAYGPENADKDAAWKPLTRGIGSWDIDLESQFGGRDHCAAYVRTHVYCPSDQDASLELGSDDAIKAWLNGELVHERYAQRGLAPRQDVVKVTLRRGWNTLLLKVVDHEGGWTFCCRLRKPDGSALPDVKVLADNP